MLYNIGMTMLVFVCTLVLILRRTGRGGSTQCQVLNEQNIHTGKSGFLLTTPEMLEIK